MIQAFDSFAHTFVYCTSLEIKIYLHTVEIVDKILLVDHQISLS